MAEKKIYHVAVYLRLSKGDGDVDGIEKAESNSISNQRMIIDRYLSQHPEMQVVDTYIDDGYTGTNYKRPELKRMLYDIDDGRIDCIVVKDLSRFGRERIETGNYISKVFKEKGVRFIAINDHYDSLTADGSETHLIMPIKALTNDNFSRDISLKVRSSLAVKKEKGEYVAPFAPYGYKKDPENVNHLIIDEPAAEIVRKIFARKIEGLSANAIAEELNRTGVLTPADYKRSCGDNYKKGRKPGKSVWSAAQVIRILKNEMVIGNMIQSKSSLVSYKVKKFIKKPRDEWDIVEGTHEAIISEADYQIVQSLMERDVIKIADTENPNKIDNKRNFPLDFSLNISIHNCEDTTNPKIVDIGKFKGSVNPFEETLLDSVPDIEISQEVYEKYLDAGVIELRARLVAMNDSDEYEKGDRITHFYQKIYLNKDEKSGKDGAFEPRTANEPSDYKRSWCKGGSRLIFINSGHPAYIAAQQDDEEWRSYMKQEMLKQYVLLYLEEGKYSMFGNGEDITQMDPIEAGKCIMDKVEEVYQKSFQ